MTAYATVGSIGRIEIGTLRQIERNFVLSSWVQSQVDAMGHGERTQSKHRHAYLTTVGKDVEEIMRGGATTFLVARDAECAARAYGWIAGGYLGHRGALYWCFVKRDHRREGVARVLLAALQRELDGVQVYSLKSRHSALCERLGLTYQPLNEGRRSA